MRHAVSLSTPLLTLLLSTAPALAEAPAAIHLEYVRAPGAETCPDESTFRHLVAAALDGADPFTAKAPRRLTVQLDRKGERFTGSYTVHEPGYPPTVRRFGEYASCSELTAQIVQSVGVLLLPPTAPPRRGALDIDGAPHNPAAPLPSPLHGAPAAPPLAPDDAPPRRHGAGLQFQTSAGAFIPVRASPRLTPGFIAAVGLRWRMASLNLEGRVILPRSTDAQTYGKTATLASYAGSIVPCTHYAWVFGCGVFSVGVIHYTADQAPESTDTRSHIEIGGRAGLAIPMPGPFSVQLTSDVVYIPSGYRVTVNRLPVWELPSVAWLPALRVAAAF